MASPAGQRFELFWQRNKEKFPTEKIGILGSEEPLNYSCLRSIKNCEFYSSQKDCLKEAKKLGFIIETSITKKFDAVILELTKNTDHNLSLFAMAEESLNLQGVLVLNGNNNLGIQSLIKKINFYWMHTDLLVKSRGRIAYFIKEINLSRQIKHWKQLSKLKMNKDGYYTCPDMFSPKQIDQGSIKLANMLKNSLHGKVADLGSGWGYLSKSALSTNFKIDQITMFEKNFSAINAAKLNVLDRRATFKWLNIEVLKKFKTKYDHIICNPPFHKGPHKKIDLLQSFINCSAQILKKNGSAWMVFISDIGVENYIENAFGNFKLIERDRHYKVYEMSKIKKKGM